MFHGGWEDGSVGSVDRSALLGKAESAVSREKKRVEDRRRQTAATAAIRVHSCVPRRNLGGGSIRG